ncbi:SUMF1/EgtB/PvdO family nonheme iron enzyme [Candidatus Dependentiae bacterium]|nr:SUMF1/EgtB/PvdO family nonheme iron enzyme [Candidatus Dependentiae bacterium]
MKVASILKSLFIICGIILSLYLIYYGSIIGDISDESENINKNYQSSKNVNFTTIPDTVPSLENITDSNNSLINDSLILSDTSPYSVNLHSKIENKPSPEHFKSDVSFHKIPSKHQSEDILKKQIIPEQELKNYIIQNSIIQPESDDLNDTKNMIFIPAGNFEFGDKETKKNIFVEEFYIDKFEVSNAEFKTVFNDFKYNPGDDNKPVTQITISEAMNYARRKGKDLPTAFEWEKAAGWNSKLNKKHLYPWGDEFKKNYTVSFENSGFALAEIYGIKYKDISSYGVIFMAGNVSEWTKTRLHEIMPDSDNKIKNNYICKGGSFVDTGEKCSVDYIYHSNGAAQTGIGFRCVKRIKSN